ncbi:MAG: adenylate cyclase [Bacteroidia bacterium]|nr:adenylate cyclase [Bacteroidia bacterium]
MKNQEKSKERRSSEAIVARNYIGRIVIYLLFLGSLIPELISNETPLFWWIYILGFLLLFPHIAYQIAKRSKYPSKAEQRNILIEGFCEGNLYVGILFSPVSVVTFFCIGAIYIGFYGGLKLYSRSRAVMLLGLLLAGLIFGFNFDLSSAPYTIYISSIILPLIILGLVVKIRDDYNRSRTKNKKNQDRLLELASKLAKYLSPQVYRQIFLGKKEVALESYRKKLTIFFSDIKGFTSLTDSMESETLSALLNSYFNEMARIALKYGGTIDKYMGDAVMIFFGDPESRGERKDAIACINMALEMKASLEEMRVKWEADGISKDLRIRMGINTGYCTVGNFGSDDRMDYTIIGGQVNLASRLESNAEVDQILISHETYVLVKDHVRCSKKDEIMVKGIAYPVQTYQVEELILKTEKSNRSISEKGPGFSLTVDLENLNKQEAISHLKEIIEKLELE